MERVESWLTKLQSRARQTFSELGYPTTFQEEWRFTNVEPIAKTEFQMGEYSIDLSQKDPLPDGVVVQRLSEALRRNSALFESTLGQLASFEEHPFTAQNTANFEDGAFVYVPKGVVLPHPIQLNFSAKSRSEPTVIYPRILVIVEKDAEASIVETFSGSGEGVYFTNVVTEVVVGENATVDTLKLQNENHNAFHMARIQVRQERNSRFTHHSFSIGGRLVRNDINVELAAEGVECTLNGLYLLGGEQHVDHHTRIDHQKPHGTSRELYKGILDGKSRAVFDGMIIVHPNAQKTDAMQTNKNLLLSDDCLVDTKPELKIFANDVKCKHGATIGQIDPDLLFYLRSRGISHEKARQLLIYGFASEMIERIRMVTLRDQLSYWLMRRLPGGMGVTAHV